MTTILEHARLEPGLTVEEIVDFDPASLAAQVVEGITAEQASMLLDPDRAEGDAPAQRDVDARQVLATCRNLVGLLGGEINCTSEPSAGSVVWFAVPLGPVLEPNVASA